MKRDPETFEIFHARSAPRVLLAGVCGALIGAIVFGFCAGIALGISQLYLVGNPLGILLWPIVGAIFAVVLYCAFALISFWIGFVFSHFTGHTMDLRVLAVLEASATVYLPFAYFMFVSVDRAPGSSFSYSLENVLLVLAFLLPAMTLVSIGAWSWADVQLEKSFMPNAPSTRRFGLQKLFGATFLLATLLFLSQFFNISILLWVGYVVLLVPVSLLTAFFVWALRFWPQSLRWKAASDVLEERSTAHGEAIEKLEKPENEGA